MFCSGSRKKEHGLAPLSPCGPSLTLGVELPLDAFFLSARDQRFESVSLQRRVCLSPQAALAPIATVGRCVTSSTGNEVIERRWNTPSSAAPASTCRGSAWAA